MLNRRFELFKIQICLEESMAEYYMQGWGTFLIGLFAFVGVVWILIAFLPRFKKQS